ncbi:DUF1837 domain-containing protein [Methylicorpusculum oleiharenae]|uniref:Hachiman antiphage defense system protein HamA n=1 Tax=Methylicorpusculum oleiharenae TaxID=1338687 RepID=UPI0013580429|nr:Hachiman antiphage defense system protein HamA [Methylicorpusculum oleiharenae]MCD2450198.1 DUF1837 domain-containing protein [Methylicorpusculum oleiharenae]
MLNITNKSEVSSENSHGHTFCVIKLKPEEFDSLVSELVDLLPTHYVAPESIADILNRLGKGAAAKKLRDKIPTVKNIRSGDVGEVMTTDYIEEFTNFKVPIRKLRWRDHRDMAMRGDDVIGIYVNQENQSVRFLKAEAKANRGLNRDVLGKARKELDNDEGLPAPHALGFVIDRLKESGNNQLADLIEKMQLVNGIRENQVEHLLFTFTASDPATLQKEAFESYDGNIKQTSVGFRVNNHQELISKVYQGVMDGLDG